MKGKVVIDLYQGVAAGRARARRPALAAQSASAMAQDRFGHHDAEARAHRGVRAS